MRYLLVDRIIEWQKDERIKGIKNVAMTEDFLEFHFPGNPIMPGVLLIESLSQLAGWLEAASSDFKSWALITSVRSAKFYGFARPGDSVELEVRSTGSESGLKKYSGIGIVQGKKKITAEFEGEIISLSEIEDVDEQKRFFEILKGELQKP